MLEKPRPYTVWHYTIPEFLSAIWESGEPLPANSAKHYALPLLWFSANQDWEPMAATLYRRKRESVNALRFGLNADDPRLMNWKDTCVVAGCNRAIRRKTEVLAAKHGANPDNWSTSAVAIPIAGLEFQIFRGGRWVYGDAFNE